MESSKEDEVEVVSWSVCRICLNSNANANATTPLESSADPDATGNYTLNESIEKGLYTKVYECTLGIMLEKIAGVSMAGGLPDVICSTCAGDLRVAIALRRRARASDRTLRTLMKKVSLLANDVNDFTDTTDDFDTFETDETVRIYKKDSNDTFVTDETVQIYKKDSNTIDPNPETDFDTFETDETVRIYKKDSNTIDPNLETDFDTFETDETVRIYKKDSNDTFVTDETVQIYKKDSNTIDPNPETDFDTFETDETVRIYKKDSNTIDPNPETNDWTEYLDDDQETYTEQLVDENTCTSPDNISKKPPVSTVKTVNETEPSISELETQPIVSESDMQPVIEERITKTNTLMFDIAVQTYLSSNEKGALKISPSDEVVRVPRPSVSESETPIKEIRTQITEKAVQTVICNIYNKKFYVPSNPDKKIQFPKKDITTSNRENKKPTSLLDLLVDPNTKLSKIPVEPDFVDVTKPEIMLKPVSVKDVLKAVGPDKLPLQHLKKIQQKELNDKPKVPSQETPEELQKKPRDILAEAIKITDDMSNPILTNTPVFVDSVQYPLEIEVESQPTLEEKILKSVKKNRIKLLAKSTGLKTDIILHEENTDVHSAVCPHPDCGRTFTSNKYVIKHIKTCHESVKPVGIYYLCVKCGKKNRTKSEAILHMRRWHKNKKKIEEKKPGLKLNQENRTKKIKPKIFKREKTFQCEQCGHLMFHNNELLEHIRSKHTGERPFRCPDCDKGFYGRRFMIRHRRTHCLDRERLFVCTICGKRFHNNDGLNLHMHCHSDVKYSCQECGKQYGMQTTLDRHMRFVHGLYRFATRTGTYNLLPSTQPVSRE